MRIGLDETVSQPNWPAITADASESSACCNFGWSDAKTMSPSRAEPMLAMPRIRTALSPITRAPQCEAKSRTNRDCLALLISVKRRLSLRAGLPAAMDPEPLLGIASGIVLDHPIESGCICNRVGVIIPGRD